ncbi:MAG TPA: helix-turn-helix domain-containing protein [Acidimicrobiia bacterium]
MTVELGAPRMADPETPDPRTRLREVALDLFGRQGVRETSTRQILTAAGMRNPSAISYYFGSKAELVEDLAAELLVVSPVLVRQIELAAGPSPPPADAWTAIAVDLAVNLVSTERGCLLARLWWEYDGYLRPAVVEEFIGSDRPLARDWMDAVERTFPLMPRLIAVGRNVTMLRTLEWMIARRAGRVLTGSPSPALAITTPPAFRTLLFEVALGIVTQPTTLTDDDVKFTG